MDSRTSTAEPQQSYSYATTTIPSWQSPSSPTAAASSTTAAASQAPPATWPTSSPSSATATSTTRNSTAAATTPSTRHAHAHTLDGSPDVASASSTASSAGQIPGHVDLLPYSYLLPHQTNYYAQLLHYNKLISPTRGGGLQATPLPPVVSASNAQAGPRSRSSSKVSLKDNSSGKGNAAGGHGSRSHNNTDKNRSVITPKEPSSGKMAPKQSQAQNQAQTHHSESSRSQQARSGPSVVQAQSHSVATSSSVPSTPHQRARQFSFESREPSPTEVANSHSPRSAYSETNSTLPSLRPLPPPRHGGCKYETAQVNSRRRMPYSIGDEKLENIPLQKIKGKLTEEEERKVATDMREVYDRLLPSEKVEEKRKMLVRKLEKIFNDEWPGHDIKAHLFGSSGNLLCSDDSDVDICITTPWKEMEHVCMIADLLARRGMEKVVCISAAKVPIVKIWDPELGLACDMNVNNTLALENTRMIRVYVDIDPRVRQLMMIIKYWTRRRIINDAAFGGTLSSYTWICLIIVFLQLRTPPVLPAIHQLPYKMPKSGPPSEFADNLKKLRGFGSKNKASEADLLFQFFRFYAHEFDYEKYALSVRLGNMIPKSDKKWQNAMNNSLCVEEPFNLPRNLGNTADEYSFKGLHMELRRAFDLISAAKFKEACEPYVFPKEEERVWTRPAPQPRPALLRSASQTNHNGRGGRGNHRGARHNNHRGGGGGGGGGGGSNRRASSSVPTYDNTNMFAPTVNIQQDLSWYPNAQLAFPYSPDFLALAYQQQETFRQQQLQHMYAQSPAFAQQQGMAQPMMTSNSASGQAPSTDRSRTNSFNDNQPPMNAALRPDLFALYGMTLGSPLFTQTAASYGTYSSTPSTAKGTGQEYRRPLQRTTVTTDRGAQASSSSLRSQSQPAARSPATSQQVPAGQQPIPISQSVNNVPGAGARNSNGVPIPSFISDDTDFDETPKASSMSPRSEESKYATYFAAPDPSNAWRNPVTQVQQPAPPGSIAFGDMSNQTGQTAPTAQAAQAAQGAQPNPNLQQTPSVSSSPSRRRRLSTDQLPQTILDRRMKRTSRSPSPLGHSRAFSASNASGPSQSGSQSANSVNGRNPTRPLVVNGSGLRASVSAATTPTTPANDTATKEREDEPVENAGQVYQGQAPVPMVPMEHPLTPQQNWAMSEQPMSVAAEHRPVVVNGSHPNPGHNAPDDTSFRERVAMMNSQYLNPHYLTQDAAFGPHGHLAQTSRQDYVSQQPQNAVIAPLDLAISKDRVRKQAESDVSLLSPVYESLAPSPTTSRKPEASGNSSRASQGSEPKFSAWSGALKHNLKADEQAQAHHEGTKAQRSKNPNAKQGSQTSKVANGSRENGHVRGAHSESDTGWQKAGKGKKKGAAGPQQGNAEPPPKNTSERKGG